ncbi:MAG TPA: hypothetical protein VKF84_06315 [Candidatus Sulfotelmatobacter sp.]|nr:hypothetical protein [Candidatus Sulfotelmatobacter sp.]
MPSSGQTLNSRWPVVVTGLLALIAVVRIISTYSLTSQAFDEPCHVAAAIELLDRHTYTLDPIHPPLSRIAIGLPLYLAGERYPNLSRTDHDITYNDVGDAILYDSGHYLRNLKLARLGVLPFFFLATAIVFLWSRREYGDFAGVMSAALFTTLPNVLAFSSVAYTDIVAGSTQLALFFAFVGWLDKPTNRSALWLGFAAGLALASKATTVIFFPAAAVAIVLGKWACTRTIVGENAAPRQIARQIAIAAALAIATVWATYGFAVQHVREGMNLPPTIPAFRYFPAPLARAGRWLVASDPLIPAPALIKGVADAWVLNKAKPAAYLLGHIKDGGWWFFFLLGVAVKSPLPFLILAAVGVTSLIKFDASRRWRAMAPALAALAVFLVTMPVKYNAGVRHVMVVFPLLAIMAGCGCSYLWHLHEGARLRSPARVPLGRLTMARVAMIALLCWQGVSTVRASSDFLAYFNELAGSDPSKVMVAGCDLDCGQDLFRLSREFQARHVSHATLAIWTSADPTQMQLPQFVVPQAYRPVTGWFAISLRALRFGDSFHTTYPPGAFDWLQAYQPVGRVGKTILLYDIPESTEGDGRAPTR